MSEILHTCPACGRANFTTKGLRSHRCVPAVPNFATGLPPLSAMPKAPAKPSSKLAVLSPKKPIDLDVIEVGQISHYAKFDTDALGKRAKAMFAEVEGLKKERAMKAILTGIYLHEVRLALEHGGFMAWKKKHFSKDNATLARYMALAAVFSRKAKLLLPEMVGANQLTLELGAQDSDGRSLLAKLEKFVGADGLTTLMQKHGVLSAPPPPSPIENTPAGDQTESDANLTDEEKHAQAVADLRRSAVSTFTAFDEIGDRWQLLEDKHLEVALKGCEQLASQIRGWLDTPKARRAAFDPKPFLTGEAEKAVLARRAEGSAFASLAA